MTNATAARLRRMRTPDDEPFYWNEPAGLAIVPAERDYDHPRGATGWSPKRWWEVRRVTFTPGFHRRPIVHQKVLFEGDTLRECREWIEAQR